MKPSPLAQRFARRMAPLALVAGLVVGVVLPMVYERLVITERASEAAVWARQLAERLTALARARPQLWAYDRLSIDELAAPLVDPPINARVRIDTAERMAIYESAGVARADEVQGWAVVRPAGRAAGRVGVRLPAEGARRSAAWLWVGAPLVGVALAAGLFFLPLAAVRRGDARNGELWAAVVEANASLEARVEARTAELRHRETQLRELGARLVAVAEEERARISRDLHDDLGQVLTGLRLRLTAMQATVAVDSPIGIHLAAALSAVDDGVEEVRRLAHDLRPPALDALGLADAIASHARRWAEVARIGVDLALDPVEPPPGVAEVLFRVCQEGLTNVARHAGATRVQIALGAVDDGWRLLVEDDGRGLGASSSGGGLGLVGARERVEQAGGYLDVESRESGGTRLLAWLPPTS